MVRPHHALGHACGSAGVDEEQVITRALDIEGGAVRFRREIVEGLGERRRRAGFRDLDPGLHLGQPVADLLHRAAELGGIDHRLSVRVVEDVPDLVGRVAVVDVDVGKARLERRRHRNQVLGPIAHVDGDLVPGGGPTSKEGPRQIVRGSCGLRPRDDPIAVDEGRSVRWQHRLDSVEYVSEIPAHVSLPGSCFPVARVG